MNKYETRSKSHTIVLFSRSLEAWFTQDIQCQALRNALDEAMAACGEARFRFKVEVPLEIFWRSLGICQLRVS